MIEDNDKQSDILAMIIVAFGIMAGLFIFISFFRDDLRYDSNYIIEYIVTDIFDNEYTISANNVKEIYLEEVPENTRKYIVFYDNEGIVYTIEYDKVKYITPKE